MAHLARLPPSLELWAVLAALALEGGPRRLFEYSDREGGREKGREDEHSRLKVGRGAWLAKPRPSPGGSTGAVGADSWWKYLDEASAEAVRISK